MSSHFFIIHLLALWKDHSRWFSIIVHIYVLWLWLSLESSHLVLHLWEAWVGIHTWEKWNKTSSSGLCTVVGMYKCSKLFKPLNCSFLSKRSGLLVWEVKEWVVCKCWEKNSHFTTSYIICFIVRCKKILCSCVGLVHKVCVMRTWQWRGGGCQEIKIKCLPMILDLKKVPSIWWEITQSGSPDLLMTLYCWYYVSSIMTSSAQPKCYKRRGPLFTFKRVCWQSYWMHVFCLR